jgi:hypothetical protein
MAEGKPYTPGFAEAVRAHKLVAAVENSAASGRAVTVYGD